MDTSQLNELLECSVCLERLDQTSKVLPCQHTFCGRCLKEIVERRKELRCPECRVLVESDVDDLPANILLVRILEGLKSQKRNRRSLDSDGGIEAHNLRNTSDQSSTGKAAKLCACAKALYDYDPKEQGDLSLHKGEEIKLIRQVDENWYEGEVNGSQGYLPANYVEIIRPLPSLDDTCPGAVAKALYDFEDEKEPDILTFKQGDVIKVIRSVDENWCEGVLDNNLGIFPLSFVELNSLAKTRIQAGEQSSLDELSTSDEADDSNASQTSPNRENSRQPKRHTIHVELNREDEASPPSRLRQRHSLEISSSERLAETYSRGSTLLRKNPRDGAFTAAATSGRPDSASPSGGQSFATVQSSANSSSSPSRRSSEELVDPPGRSGRGSAEGSPTLTSSAKPGVRSASLRRSPPTEARRNSRPPSAELEKDLHIALFSYKPQKEDEIELVKGVSYYVLEKCKDGWFRGYSVGSQNRGVFPGNYVRLASIHNMLTRARSSSGGRELADTVTSQQQQQQQQQQKQQQQQQHRERNSTGSIELKSKYRRSESAPPPPRSCPAVPVESLVVNLDSWDRSESRSSPRVAGETSARPTQHPALPPPPAPKTSSFWKKLKGKKKDKPPKPLPPPPYYRFAPAGHSQLSFGPESNALHQTLPSYSQATREESRGQNTRRQRQRVENAPPRERYRVNVAYPSQNEAELELRVGDIVYVARKRQDGWYKGTLERNGKTGLFPGSFVEYFS